MARREFAELRGEVEAGAGASALLAAKRTETPSWPTWRVVRQLARIRPPCAPARAVRVVFRV
jgi:hypothetical protein